MTVYFPSPTICQNSEAAAKTREFSWNAVATALLCDKVDLLQVSLLSSQDIEQKEGEKKCGERDL